MPRRHQLALQKLFASNSEINSTLYGVDHATMPRGVNNPFTQNLRFQMGMKSWRIAHFTLSDNDTERYSVPTSALPNPVDD
jgi:hypothetical protein